jgi:chemotaxis protein methyltransferase CheR
VRPASEEEWKLLGDLIEARLGIVFDPGRRDILESRLEPRLAALHLDTLTDYYHHLIRHPRREQEQAELAKHVTNGETYFFRESQQFDLLTHRVLPELHGLGRLRPLRILSAGCSSGEEPYSLAFSLRDAGLAASTWEVDGCDVNGARLEKARAGLFDEPSLRVCDEGRRRRYFQPAAGRFRVRGDFRDGVRFFFGNLAGDDGGLLRSYDVVFCRNVLIYFSEIAFHRAVDLLARHLVPGGYLFLGHSESLIDRRSDFDPLCLDGKIVYRRKEDEPSSGSS